MNIFLDCGTHLCEGLLDFWNNKIIDETFEIHTFEPNPACFVEERISSLPFKVVFHNCAVWTDDEEVNFRQENHKESKTASPTDNRSDIDGWGSSVEGIGFFHGGYLTPPIKVKAIDFSKFVKDLPEGSKIICKMDIEGSEFKVLRKMIKEETIRKIDAIYVEFHERSMKDESVSSKNEIVKKIQDMGIKIYPWS